MCSCCVELMCVELKNNMRSETFFLLHFHLQQLLMQSADDTHNLLVRYVSLSGRGSLLLKCVGMHVHLHVYLLSTVSVMG